MTIKRRDNKNRILHTGESQRKDGRYAYKYIDALGKTQFLYSWRLTSADSTPKGKKHDISLREKIKELQLHNLEGLDINGKNLTVYNLFKRCLKQKKNIRLSTKDTYKNFLKLLEKESIGKRTITDIKVTEAKQWLMELEQKGLSYSTIKLYKSIIKDAFKTAVHDDFIRKNPFDFSLSSIIANNTVGREALTKLQEEQLLQFMQDDSTYKKYYDEIVILLGTGLRISELCGLKLSDIDLKQKKIQVRHQLKKIPKIGYVLLPPKSECGLRDIPMSEDVYTAFQNVIRDRKKEKTLNIDGYNGFIFLNIKGFPKVAIDYQFMMNRLIEKYNNTHEVKLPQVTPHVLRHTFCSRLANKGMSPKALQYVMGHSDITITLNLYSHADFETVQKEMNKLFK